MRPISQTYKKDSSLQLSREFYTRPTLTVAKELLGKHFVRVYQGEKLVARIVEVESYIGEDDPACHARFGATDRNRVMYGIGGFSYVYFIYGMYNMLNVVTESEGSPAAVLIRALEPVSGIETMKKLRRSDSMRSLTNGPGKLCMALGIDTSHSGIDLTGSEMFILNGDRSALKIASSTRIGIKDGTNRPWRFFEMGNRFVSR